ncbi:Cytochrome b5 [Nymphaea thermarum]|nr:Cytochrome b5 [Nymphaea thermarum]
MGKYDVFSLSQVAKHKSRKDCWFVINGRVYDVTKFLEEHPGGDDVLVEVAGRDATKEFDAIGHSTGAKQLLFKYQVGVLEGFKLQQAEEEGDRQGGGPVRKAGEEMSAKVVKEDAVAKWGGLIEFVVPLFVALFFWGYKIVGRDVQVVN